MVDEIGQAFLSLTVIGAREAASLQALIDTGFTGAVAVPIPIGVHLGLELIITLGD